MENIIRWILMPFAILHVKWIQYRYKQITENNIHFNHTNQVLSKLSLLQSKIYYYKSEFHAWGFYHPSCVWTYKDEIFHNWLFPLRDFEEIEVVVWNKHETRIFKRPKGVVGRNVRNCHPPRSVDKVEKIIEEMKNGSRDKARFWIDLDIKGVEGKQKVMIEYYALRDAEGKYLGVLEASQNITEIQQLKNQKRLLD